MTDTGLPAEPAPLAERLLGELALLADPDNVAGMARFGISVAGTLGVPVAQVRGLAREAKRSLAQDPDHLHELAALLWGSGVHEARIMAAILDAPALVTREQAEAWALDLDSWDTCDQLCGNLLWRVDFAWRLPPEWTTRRETFVKRAGLVVIAQLAVKDKKAPDTEIVGLLDLVESGAFDERNDVKKAASWALRQVGKRSATCHGPAVACAERVLARVPSRGGTAAESAARWVARDALRELRSQSVLNRLRLG